MKEDNFKHSDSENDPENGSSYGQRPDNIEKDSNYWKENGVIYTKSDDNTSKSNKTGNSDSRDMSMADRFITAMFLPNEYDNLLGLKFGKVAGYFCMLILLASVVQYAIPVLGAVAGYGGVRSYIMNELPEFSLKNGEFFVDQIIEENNEDVGMYLLVNTDVEKFTADDIPGNMLQAMLISRTNILMYNNVAGINGLVQEQPFSMYGNINMDNESVAGLAPVIYICMFFIFILMYLISFVRFLISGLMYSVFMLLISKILMTNFTFGKIYEISLFAQSVGVLVSAISVCIGSNVVVMTGSTFGMLVTIMIMNRVLFRHSGRPVDY